MFEKEGLKLQTLIVVAHPNITDSPTQQFLKASLPDADVIWHDLSSEGQFDRQRELHLLAQADRIIFQFPFYWYSAPFILKKWQDEVFSGEQGQYQFLAGKQLALVVSLGQSLARYQSGGSEHYAMSELLRPYQAFADKLGWHYLTPLLISHFAYSTEAEKQALLIRYQQFLTMDDPTNFAAQGDWLVAQLEKMATAHPTQAANVSLVSEQLTTQLEQYRDLIWQVSQIKQGEKD